MDRSSINETARKQLIYQNTLEFIGEVRASISWERFSMQAIRYFDAVIDFLNDTQETREFLAQRRIERSYVTKNLQMILDRIYFNPENDHYLTLGLTRNASPEQIHNRWKSLMVLYHPDRNRDDDGYAGKCASRINEAYSVLKDSRQRMEYDRKMPQKKPSAMKQQAGMIRTRALRETTRREIHSIMSPRMRRILANLLLPVWLLICALILLAIFLESKGSRTSVRPAVPAAVTGADAVNIPAQSRTVEQLPVKNDEHEIGIFLSRYITAYEQGDMKGLFSLFARSASEKSRIEFDEMRKARLQAFGDKTLRYTIKNVEFQDMGEAIVVRGEYRIEGGDGKNVDSARTGNVRWTLVRENGNLRIAGVEND